jgi:hypothetical protein
LCASEKNIQIYSDSLFDFYYDDVCDDVCGDVCDERLFAFQNLGVTKLVEWRHENGANIGVFSKQLDLKDQAGSLILPLPNTRLQQHTFFCPSTIHLQNSS